MKILHCCLAAVYVDNYGYQENIFPKMHKLQGYEVMIVASTETFIDNSNLGYVKPSSYVTEYNVPIQRLAYVSWLPHIVAKKLRIYKGLETVLNQFNPDIIFLHDIQFLSITVIAQFAKKHPNTVIYADGHTDFINSARNWLSKNILHKILYKKCAKIIEPFVRKFYGVLPLRVDFFKDVYKIDPLKIELLLLGGDLTEIDFSKKTEIRLNIRENLGINNNDFLIITGGKIDRLKNIHLLMKAVSDIANPNIKLIVFGNVHQELKEEFDYLSQSDYVKYVGWTDLNEQSNYFLASDLAFFPGTHSVLWEHSASLGLPGVFKKWKGMHHMDIGGNCIFLEEVNVKSIVNVIMYLYKNPKKFQNMKIVAENKGINEFSYFEIAKRAIEQ